ncbi:uncharacterized protein A1O9_10514 [Exophiala aquamarina CBS 119918]|uniref:Uncharacterized protein n=1 Tax=Exophiala aquamarina CBS 119918 TaxID=1182545 RepID=A0A072P089_9EURO|nr:uncharacterized protein A1O9_10514 [Exophiala aquamarina CBS 119918]KEF53539.1 hypothetical protein A1O9_10514 [Exophiala aquamarina CBS 119918]
MREVTDEALQRLYRACRSNSGFPGEIPDESQGPPSTTAILDALDLWQPSLEDMGQTENLRGSISTSPLKCTTHWDLSKPQHQGRDPSSEEPSTKDENLHSSNHSSVNVRWGAQSLDSSPSLNAAPTLSPATPPPLDISEQFQYEVSGSSFPGHNSGTAKEEHPCGDDSANPAFDIDAYLDTSSCTIPSSGPHPAYNNIYASMQFDIPAMMDTSRATQQVDTDFSEPGAAIFMGGPAHWLQLIRPQL